MAKKQKATCQLTPKEKERREESIEAMNRFRAAVKREGALYAKEHPEMQIDKERPAFDEREAQSRELFTEATRRACMFLSAGMESKVQNDDELMARSQDFLAACCDLQQLPNMENYCLSIGYTTVWFENVITGKALGFTTQTKDILLRVRQAIASIHSDLAERGKLSPLVYIYYSKNYLGMSDKKTVEVSVNVGQKSASQLLEEAEELPDIPIPAEYKEK